MAIKDIGRRLLVGGGSVHGARPRAQCARCTAAAGWRRPRFLTTTTTTTTTTTATATTTAGRPPPPTPLRKQIKDEAKARKRAAQSQQQQQAPDWRRAQAVPGWELTVGIEIHAQLNTARKLFSRAAAGADGGAAPNTRVALFDAALPGAQPLFQAAVVVPAVRAALALGCAVQPVSRFDRKHYFHWDQPAGYQITQYYEPLARAGRVVLRARDGVAEEAGDDDVAVDIVQVQLEQDTGKTLAQPGGSGDSHGGADVHWLDLNRAGVALVEIISAPQIRHPATAAAFVRKVQQLLRAVDACTAGMEAGGLRADVNVSVRRTGQTEAGTRTEIKNLNSFRAVEDAVLAERNRQIAVLEAGGQVAGETRGWTPGTGATGGATHRLRSKAGAVDYRYMPDPDLAPLRIDPALPARLAATLGVLPDAEVDALVAHHGLTTKDALALAQLDDGGRAQFYYDVVAAFEARLGPAGTPEDETAARRAFVANWVVHQLGRLTSERHAAAAAAATAGDLQMTPAGRCRIPAAALAELLAYRHQGRITAGVAKELLFALFRGDIGAAAEKGARFATVADAIDAGGLWFREIDAAAYADLARQALDGEAKTLRPFVEHAAGGGGGGGKTKKYPHGKLQYLTGKLMRLGPEGRTDPQAAEAAVRRAVEDYVREQGGRSV